MTHSNDRRFERFKELSDGVACIRRVVNITLIAVIPIGFVSCFFLRGLLDGHWAFVVLVVGFFVLMVSLPVCVCYSVKKLALKLNVYCSSCKKTPPVRQLPMAIATQACPSCGRKFEIEHSPAGEAPKAPPEDRRSIQEIMTPSNDRRPERFKELADGIARNVRVAIITFFTGLAIVAAIRLFFGGNHWALSVSVLGLIVLTFPLGSYCDRYQKKLALKLNVYCSYCRKPPVGQLPMAIATQACPSCGRKFEIEPSPATEAPKAPPEDRRSIQEIMTHSNDRRVERFKELSDGIARNDRVAYITIFAVIAIVAVSCFFLRGLPDSHRDRAFVVLVLGFLCVLFSLLVYECSSAKKLALKLNVYCSSCKKTPPSRQLSMAIATRACPICGRKFEIEPSPAGDDLKAAPEE